MESLSIEIKWIHCEFVSKGQEGVSIYEKNRENGGSSNGESTVWLQMQKGKCGYCWSSTKSLWSGMRVDGEFICHKSRGYEAQIFTVLKSFKKVKSVLTILTYKSFRSVHTDVWATTITLARAQDFVFWATAHHIMIDQRFSFESILASTFFIRHERELTFH